jgi:hypothetical protein
MRRAAWAGVQESRSGFEVGVPGREADNAAGKDGPSGSALEHGAAVAGGAGVEEDSVGELAPVEALVAVLALLGVRVVLVRDDSELHAMRVFVGLLPHTMRVFVGTLSHANKGFDSAGGVDFGHRGGKQRTPLARAAPRLVALEQGGMLLEGREPRRSASKSLSQ